MSTADPNDLREAARSGIQRTLIEEMMSTSAVPFAISKRDTWGFGPSDGAVAVQAWSNLRERLEALGVVFGQPRVETNQAGYRTGYFPVTLPFTIVEQVVDFPFTIQRTGPWVRSPDLGHYFWQRVEDIEKMKDTQRGEVLKARMLIHAVTTLPMPEPEEFGARVVVDAFPVEDGETAPTLFVRVTTDPYTLGADWLSERGGSPFTWDEILPYDPRLA